MSWKHFFEAGLEFDGIRVEVSDQLLQFGSFLVEHVDLIQMRLQFRLCGDNNKYYPISLEEALTKCVRKYERKRTNGLHALNEFKVCGRALCHGGVATGGEGI